MYQLSNGTPGARYRPLFGALALLLLAAIFYPATFPVERLLAQSVTLLDEQVRDSVASSSSSYLATNGDSLEAIDDIAVTGEITRIYVQGNMPSFSARNFQGVTVRFYAQRADGTPGARQAEIFLPVGSANLRYEASSGDWLELTLPAPFAASGRHFLGVQPHVDGWNWYSGTPQRSPLYYRVNSTVWTPAVGSGLNFQIYGTGAGGGTPVIDTLSTTNATRSGYFELTGSNFGSTPGRLLVNNLAALVADWRTNQIIGYVPEGAALGNATVQVDNGNALSNVQTLNVTNRPAPAGRVNWKIRVPSFAAGRARPALATDGTIYQVDVGKRLYAIAPNGALKWIVQQAGSGGTVVGPDGTIYTSDQSIGVKAYNPDGSLKWHFADNTQRNHFDLKLGPDGHLYITGLEGIGVYSLTTAGQLRWSQPNLITGRNCRFDLIEMAFGTRGGAAVLLTYSENLLLTYRLQDGQPVGNPFPIGCADVATSPVDGTLHQGGNAYSRAGALLWSKGGGGLQMSSEGISYVLAALDPATPQLRAYAPNGNTLRAQTVDFSLYDQLLSPDERLLVISAQDANRRYFVTGYDAQTFTPRWSVTTPYEEPQIPNGALNGYIQQVYSKMRITADGSTLYFGTYVADGAQIPQRSYIWSINAAGNDSTHQAVAIAAAAPTQGRAPLVVSFDGAASYSTNGTITAYAWDFGDGNTATSANPTHTYTTPGTYHAVLTVTDSSGAVSVVTPESMKTIVVNASSGNAPHLYLSSSTNGRVSGITFRDEDILAYNKATGAWSLYFDGSDVGLGATDLDALYILADGNILLSLEAPAKVAGITVDDSDILLFQATALGATTAGSFRLYFDGSAAGLTTNAEDVDAIAFTPDDKLIVSTAGNFKTNIAGADEDLIVFDGSSWALYFDGSAVGLSAASEDLWDAWVDPANGHLHLAVQGAYTVNGGVRGVSADILECTPIALGANTNCTFGIFWPGATSGIAGEITDGYAVGGTPPTAIFSANLDEDVQAAVLDEVDDTVYEDPSDAEHEQETDEQAGAESSELTLELYLPLIQD